jgi:23S rRNA (pseudouridine1915-N3)-methyltransferase
MASIATVKIVVLAVGRLRPPFADDVQHYQKLLARHGRLELVEVREDERAARRLPAEAHVCLLDVEGRTRDSLDLARWLEDRRHAGRDLWFVIGGPHGIRLDREPDDLLSLGAMTLPHQLARVVLLEQLYRAHKILAREPYHY